MARDTGGSSAWLAYLVGIVLVAVLVAAALVGIRGGAALRQAHVALNLPSADSLHRAPSPAPPLPTPPRS